MPREKMKTLHEELELLIYGWDCYPKSGKIALEIEEEILPKVILQTKQSILQELEEFIDYQLRTLELHYHSGLELVKAKIKSKKEE